MFKRVKVKKGDTVKVISGGNRGKEGTVLSVDRQKDRVVVEGVPIVTKHVKQSPPNPKTPLLSVQGGADQVWLQVIVIYIAQPLNALIFQTMVRVDPSKSHLQLQCFP